MAKEGNDTNKGSKCVPEIQGKGSRDGERLRERNPDKSREASACGFSADGIEDPKKPR